MGRNVANRDLFVQDMFLQVLRCRLVSFSPHNYAVSTNIRQAWQKQLLLESRSGSERLARSWDFGKARGHGLRSSRLGVVAYDCTSNG